MYERGSSLETLGEIDALDCYKRRRSGLPVIHTLSELEELAVDSRSTEE